MVLGVFLAGALLLGALVRAWRPALSWRTVSAYLLLTTAYFALPLCAGRLQAPVDIAYQWRPWSETRAEKVEPGNGLLSDIPLQILPFRLLVRQRLLHGAAPLWAHELGTGQALLGNAQSAPFAPLHLLALPLPPLAGLAVATAWQVLLALLLMHALLLALGAGEAGAALAAVAYAFSAYATAWAFYPLGMAAAWLPGVLLGVLLVARQERGGFAGLVACGTGLALSGHPETLAYAALACAALTAAILVRRRPGRGQFLLRLTGAAVLTFCLSAPALLPFLEEMPGSERRAAFAAHPQDYAPPPYAAWMRLPLLDPLVFGSPRDGNWVGPINWNETCTAYAGLVALGLALAGAVALRGRVLAIFAAGAASLLAALHVAPFYPAVVAIPGFGFGAHARLRLLWVLAVAIAAGLSVERLAMTRWSRAAAGAALAALAYALLHLPPLGFHPWQRAWWYATVAGAVVGAVVACASLWAARLRPWFAPLAVVAVACDLLLLGVRYTPVVAPHFDLAPPPALAVLIDENRRSAAPFRVIAEDLDLMPNLPAIYGLWDPRGNDPMRPAAAARWVGEALSDDYRPGDPSLLTRRDPPQEALDALGVRFFLARHRRHLPAPWVEVADLAGGRIWRNPQARGLFTLAGGTVTVDSVPPNGWVLAVASPRGGRVASTVSAAPGWRLAVDGRAQGWSQVEGAFVGFDVGPGEHRVTLDYRPMGWRVGLVLWACGVVWMGVAVGRRRRLGIFRTSRVASKGRVASITEMVRERLYEYLGSGIGGIGALFAARATDDRAAAPTGLGERGDGPNPGLTPRARRLRPCRGDLAVALRAGDRRWTWMEGGRRLGRPRHSAGPGAHAPG